MTIEENMTYCSACNVYADAEPYCRECLDKLEYFHKQQERDRIIKLLEKLKKAACGMVYEDHAYQMVIDKIKGEGK